MSITIVSKTTDYQKPSDRFSSGYTTVYGEVTVRAVKGQLDATVLDGMIDAQNDLGQITWHDITMNIAQGTLYNSEHGGRDRVAVIDTDNADGADIIAAINALHSPTR